MYMAPKFSHQHQLEEIVNYIRSGMTDLWKYKNDCILPFPNNLVINTSAMSSSIVEQGMDILAHWFTNILCGD